MTSPLFIYLWSNKMKVFLFLMSISLSVHAGLSFNQISMPTQNVNNPQVVNDRLVYQDENNFLWFNDGTVNGSVQALSNGQKIVASDLVKLDNTVLFVNRSDNSTLWQTDGVNASKFSDIQASYMHTRLSNVVAVKLSGSGNFATTDGVDVNTYDIQPLTLMSLVPSVCVFDSDNLVFWAKDPVLSFTGLYLYKSSQITQLEYDSEPIEADTLEFVLQSGDSCYYRHFDYANNIATHYKIDLQGSVSIIENPENRYFDEFFVFNNQLYLFLKGGFGGLGGLYTLSGDSHIPEEFILSSTAQGIEMTSSWVTDDYLYLYYRSPCVYKKCTPVPPNPFQLHVFNKSMQLVNIINDYRLSSFSVYGTEDKDFVVFRKSDRFAWGALIDELIEINEGVASSSSVKDAMVDINSVIGGGQQNYYAYGENRITGNKGIYKVSEQPIISSQLTGLWVSEQWQSQGLSIHTGTRADSSQYIFVSFYIYRDGQPFWLAGSAELNTGAPSQTLNLAEFKGRSFLSNDPSQDFEQISFGTITIQPQSCDSIGISIQINPVNEQSIPRQLDMDRIINTEFSNVCSDD